MTAEATPRSAHGTRRWTRPWLALLLGALLVVGVVEAALLELGATYFSSGYNGVYVAGAELLGGFALASLTLDLWLVAAVWLVLLPLARWLRLSRLQTLCAAAVPTLALPLSLDFLRYRLHYVLGDVTGIRLLWELSGESSFEVAAQVAYYLPRVGPPALLAVALLLALLVAAPFVERRLGAAHDALRPPALRAVALLFGLSGVAGALLLGLPWVSLERIQAGLERKPSGLLLSSLGGWVTDLDRDGFHVFSALGDPAPLDAGIHPWAVDRPDDGVDANGMAGDHPASFEPQGPRPAPEAAPGPRPHVLLVFLESFRGDLLGRQLQGRPVTPFLDWLAREGASSSRAYVHTPGTVASRAQLYSGRLVPSLGEATLIDDFRRRGYVTAHFSGQNELFGRSVELLGVERADRFYDARQDQQLRTSRSTSPVGLEISWKTLSRRVFEFLAQHDPDAPLFLYVNFVDTHFPYHHAEVDLLFDFDPLERHAIRVDRVDQLWSTYLNTAANVDHAIEELVRAWWKHMGERPNLILVTADHGQSLYDDEGFLGHGRSLHAVQTRVPFVLWGIGGDWPEPLGLSDVRRLLLENLATRREGAALPRARFVPDPERSLLQYAARIDEPRLIGLRSLGSTVIYDFERDRLQVLGPDEAPQTLPPAEQAALFRQLVWTWEGVRLRNQDARDPSEPGA
jgi:hypothetical protein